MMIYLKPLILLMSGSPVEQALKERRIVTDESTCDLATIAANNALEMAGIDASELDLIILATTTPDKIFPATATMLQNKIGAILSCL